jgi:hypothetical protein
LRLREPFAQAFGALGFEGEESWRTSARIKVVLLTSAGVGREQPVADVAPKAENEDISITELPKRQDEPVGLAPSLWHDPDVRWLTGVHKAQGHEYLIRERYEELLWWTLMPSVLQLASEVAPKRSAIDALGNTVDDALAAAEAAGYRIDKMMVKVAEDDQKIEPILEDGSGPMEQDLAELDEAESLVNAASLAEKSESSAKQK